MKKFSIAAVLALLLSAFAVPAQAADELPSVPGAIVVTGRGAQSVSIAWSAPKYEGLTSLQGYYVYAKPVLDQTWVLKATVTGTSTNVTGLDSGVNHHFKVAAFNAAGEGPATFLGQSTALSAGNDFSCTIRGNRSVWCWGGNDFGQFGSGDTASSTSPREISSLLGATNISAGSNFACALKSGEVWCFGDNSHGQLGDGTQTSSVVPVKVQGISSAVVKVDAGDKNVCAVTIDGSVYCWGDGTNALIGDGGNNSSLSPKLILVAASDVSVGTLHACALMVDSSVACWGSESLTPTTIAAVPSVLAVSVGASVDLPGAPNAYGDMCAITAQRVVQCWTSDSSALIDISGPTMVMDLSVGTGHACAVTTSGATWCWGSNASGELGNANLFGEVGLVMGLPALTHVVTSSSSTAGFACGTAATGEIHCWGANAAGQLGAGAQPGGSTPLAVTGFGLLTERSIMLPSAVSGLAFVSRTPSSISITWNALTDLERDTLPSLGYVVETSRDGLTWASTQVGAQTTSLEIAGLTPGASYSVRVAGFTGAGLGVYSATQTLRTTNLPDQVTGLVHSARTENSISITWTEPAADGLPVLSYRVEWATLAGEWQSSNVVGATSYTITGLNSSTVFKIRVSAISDAGSGQPSAELSDRTLNSPAAVSGLAATARTATTISLTWTAPEADSLPILDYLVEWQGAVGGWQQVTVSSTSAVLEGLVANSDYKIRVSARSVAGVGPTSAELLEHTQRLPSKVSGITHVARSESTIEVSWQAPDGDGLAITSLKIEWSRDGVNWPSKILTGPNATATRTTLTGLRAASTYQIRITATSSAGAGDVSELFSDRTANEPAQVTGVSLVARTAKSISISWLRPNSDGLAITGYLLEISQDGETWTPSSVPGEATSGVLAGLAVNRNYKIRVTAINAAGSGLASAVLEERTSHAPAAVDSIQITVRTPSSIGIRWTPPSDDGAPITSYMVQYSENGTAWNSFAVQNSVALLTNLQPAASYYVRVIATNEAGDSPTSPELVASTNGVRNEFVTVVDATNRPVTGGTVTWRNSANLEQVLGSAPLGPDGRVEILEVQPGNVTLTLTGGVLSDGTTVSGSSEFWLGFLSPRITLPATPIGGTKVISVKLPNGRAVVGAKVSVADLSQTVRVGTFDFTTSTSLSSGVTDALGQVTVYGFASGTPIATATYFDGVNRRSVSGPLSADATILTLEDATWVKTAFTTKTVQRGARVEIQVSALSTTGVQPGVAVRLLVPKGAAQTGCPTILKGVTNTLGKVKLYACASKSGTYKIAAVGAVVTSSVTLLVNGTAPMPINRLTAVSVASRTATIGWLAPQFTGGSKITAYRITVTGGGKTVTRNQTLSTMTIKGLTSGTTYSVSVAAVNINGVSDPVTTAVRVS